MSTNQDDNCFSFDLLSAFLQMVGSGPEDQQKMVGMHFELDDMFVSRISRRLINVLKANYRVSYM